jgi:tetratricopeptide (TPR) repeat protein
MPFGFLRLLCLLVLSWSFSTPAWGQSQSPSSVPKPHPSQEEAALRAVVERYFAAYGKKDLAGVLALWSEKSLELKAYKQSLQQQLANEYLSFGSPMISRVKVESEKASLRVTIDLTSINLKSQQKSERRLVSNFELVKEGVEWKVWRYAAAAEDLAAALVKANTAAEREGLLAEEKELVTVELGRTLMNEGQQLIGPGRYQRAIDIFRLALGIAEQLDDKDVTAAAHRAIGIIHRLQGNYAEALEQSQKSLQIYEEIGDKAGIARALGNIGNVHWMKGNYAEALELYRKILQIYEELGNKAGKAQTLSNIGMVHWSQGNYSEALEQLQTSLQICEKICNKDSIANALLTIGNIYAAQGNYTKALENFRKSLRINEEISDKYGIGILLVNIGNVHNLQGNYSEALEQYQKSLQICEEISDRDGIAQAQIGIGLIHSSRGSVAASGVEDDEEFGNESSVLLGRVCVGGRRQIIQLQPLDCNEC